MSDQFRIVSARVSWLAFVIVTAGAYAAERTEHFHAEPRWESINNRAVTPEPRPIRQDFGYSRTAHAGGAPGEIGGFISAAAEPAYYARPIPAADLGQKLSASGTFACGDGGFHLLVGFFNSRTLKEWRTPNTIALRLAGRGENKFIAYLEYCTGRWRAGGDSPRGFVGPPDPASGRPTMTSFAAGVVHRWSLTYDPAGADGRGAIVAAIDDQTAECHLDAEHRADGATFDRFGLVNVLKSADSGGEVWLDDIVIGGQHEDFARDPRWDELHNRREYVTTQVRPRFDFGFSATQFAGGARPGELGGVVFRGDCRYPERLAAYADRIDELTLDKPLHAAGKVALRRGVSDSGVLLGFFNSRQSLRVNPAQDTSLPESFLGISTDAPSREGFYFAPTYRLPGDVRGQAGDRRPPRIYPDGAAHDWSLVYTPTADGGGRIDVALDEQRVQLPVPAAARAAGARFDRFGLVTTWIDGNSQTIYFDDLAYTARQD